MAQLKRLPEVVEHMNEVTFDSDRGNVKIYEWDGEVIAEIGFDEVDIDEFEEHLDEVATHEEFTDEAEQFARKLIEQSRQNADDTDDTDDSEIGDADTESGDENNTGDVVHVMDNGTEVCIGDRVNHPGGWSYKITGRADEHTLTKLDNTDDWAVVISTVERDIRENGFDERAGEVAE